MNYAEQELYFARSRVWSALAVTCFIAAAAWNSSSSWRWAGVPARVGFALIILATAVSLYYTPDYLYLSVKSNKAARWAVKLRWRIAAAALIIGIVLFPTPRGLAISAASATWIVLTTFVAGRFPQKTLLPPYFLISDLLLIYVVCLAARSVELAIVTAGVGAAFHFSIVIWSRTHWAITALFVVCSVLLIAPWITFLFLLANGGARQELLTLAAFPALVAVSVASTLALRQRARKRCERNIASATKELSDFTGKSGADIRQLWSTADKQLARNWETSGIANKSPEEIAEWYRQNSELYMFAISAYNLEYKRIKSNLKMLRYASGSCLDYGAGNGELILECARRGHRAAYYDVDGVSKRFAQFRAARYGLQVEFASTKDELRRIAEAGPFDTILSFDVLEHIPDLASELDFLISLLSPNGLLIFDVPAGATVSHPMHLNHTLNVREHMIRRGLNEVPMRSWRIGKQEKYAFRFSHPERSEGTLSNRSSVGSR